jgi:hypothetical protein
MISMQPGVKRNDVFGYAAAFCHSLALPVC